MTGANFSGAILIKANLHDCELAGADLSKLEPALADAMRAAPDRNPRNIEITEVSLGGVSDKILNSLLGFRSLRSYADQYATEYDVTSFAIEDNKVIIENGRAIPGVTK